MATHERVWEQGNAPIQEWKPKATYGLLIAIGTVFLLQLVLSASSPANHYRLFVANVDWPTRPWTLITSTLAHSPTRIFHIIFNGMFLYFLGPTVERLIGTKRFLTLFFLAGALSSILQAHISGWYELWQYSHPAANDMLVPGAEPVAIQVGVTAAGDPIFAGALGGLGASGALMMLFGVLMILIPNQKVLFWGLIPIKIIWLGLIFVAIDVFGFFNTGNQVGNMAHLAGLAVGLLWAWNFKRKQQRPRPIQHQHWTAYR